MTWSLEIRNGDLSLGSGTFEIVSAEQKLAQDLRLWFLEQMGNDDLHPEFGSLIDGGTKPDGTQIESLIGGDDDIRFAATLVESEIRRVVGAYQAQQLERAKSDQLRYGKTTLTPGEVVTSLDDVAMRTVGDTLYCILHLETGSGSTTTVDIPLANR